MKCPNCGREQIDQAVFCGYCGAGLEAPPIKEEGCPGCGAPVEPGARFCGKCGTRLDGGGHIAPAPAPAAAQKEASPAPAKAEGPVAAVEKSKEKKKKSTGFMALFITLLLLAASGGAAGFVAAVRGWELPDLFSSGPKWEVAVADDSGDAAEAPEDPDLGEEKGGADETANLPPPIWEEEPNDTIEEAGAMALDQPYAGSLSSAEDVDVFRLEVEEGTELSLIFSHDAVTATVGDGWEVAIVREGFEEGGLWAVGLQDAQTTHSGIYLEPGTFYLSVRRPEYQDETFHEDYRITLAAVPRQDEERGNTPILGLWRWSFSDDVLLDMIWRFREDGKAELYYLGDEDTSEEEGVWPLLYSYNHEEGILDLEILAFHIVWEGADAYYASDPSFPAETYRAERISERDIPPDAVRLDSW